MESNDNSEGHHYSSCDKYYSPVLDDLLSFFLKILFENVFTSYEKNDNITQCQIRVSSVEAIAVLLYHNKTKRKSARFIGTYANYLKRMISDSSSLNIETEFSEFVKLPKYKDEENVNAYRMNDILDDMLSIILDILSGTTLITSRKHLNFREYNILTSAKRPNLFFVYSDNATNEKTIEHINRKEAVNTKNQEDSSGVKLKHSLIHSPYLQSHKQRRGRPYLCKFCGKSFPHPSSLIVHERIHTGERPYNCTYCDKCFSCSANVKSHERIHTGEKPYECRYCKKLFSRPGPLKFHERLHIGEKPNKCKYCWRYFPYPSLLKYHELTHTISFQCSYCERSFTCSKDVKNHEKLHTGERLIKCKFCEKSFTRRKNVKRHERSHTGERPYTCKHCKKTFTCSTGLKRHERSHTGERPYKCKLCDKSFSASIELTRHHRIHTGEKPYKCKYCEKNFSTASSLKRHERVHTGEKPYQCEYCEKTFLCSSHMKRHEKLHERAGERQPENCGKSSTNTIGY